MRSSLAGLVAALALVARLGQPDVWDAQTQNDDTAGSGNELVHGSDQVHDLGAHPAADEDWYPLSIKPLSSYEVLVDGVSGDVGPTLEVDRVLADGTVFGTAVAVGLGFARSMRFHNPNATVVEDKFIRIRSGACTIDCTESDVYRIRYYETTGAVARFNDAGGQVTVLVLQNPTSDDITGSAYFWDTTGSLLATQPFTLTARSVLALDTSAVAGLAGQSGSITIGHDARYGDLSGKAVAVAPADGFSFDSPMTYRPR